MKESLGSLKRLSGCGLFWCYGLKENNFTISSWLLQSSRAKQLEKMFPVIDPKAKPMAKPKIFLSLLWKQLNHLG